MARLHVSLRIDVLLRGNGHRGGRAQMALLLLTATVGRRACGTSVNGCFGTPRSDPFRQLEGVAKRDQNGGAALPQDPQHVPAGGGTEGASFLPSFPLLRRDGRATASRRAVHPRHSLAEVESVEANTNDASVSSKTSGFHSSNGKRQVGVQELRNAVLHEGIPLKDIALIDNPSNVAVDTPVSHEVLRLISRRRQTRSKPHNRFAEDSDKLALCIEGGGMRGAVSAGMAGAIACLGLCDCFDSIYGSSAGSVIGAYFVSRQAAVDVYTRILTAAKDKFVCKKRLLHSILLDAVDMMLSRISTPFRRFLADLDVLPQPGMNITFVLDGIMCPQRGLRPLDMERFQVNDQLQPLRIVSSVVREGRLETTCFGSAELDFFNEIDPLTGEVSKLATSRADGERHGLFACLQASMTVPAAAGPPVDLHRHFDRCEVDHIRNITSSCFDAFCFEPLPYRIAVKEGATHTLVLRSRPQDFVPRTNQGPYDKAIAPLYFNTHRQPLVANFFKVGGQQYLYCEDLMTLEEGRISGRSGVLVPPPQVLYGGDPSDLMTHANAQREAKWKRAHVLPVTVPAGTPELPTLEQETNSVIEAVRAGFAAAFDLLAPAAGVELNDDVNGRRVAELVVRKYDEDDRVVLTKSVIAPGFLIQDDEDQQHNTKQDQDSREEVGRFCSPCDRNNLRTAPNPEGAETSPSSWEPPLQDASEDGDNGKDIKESARRILGALPGFRDGDFSALSWGLRELLADKK